MNNITGAAEVHDYRDGATGETFEDCSCAVVSNGRKHPDVSGSQAFKDFRLADPTAESNILLDSKRSGDLLNPTLLGSVANDGEPGYVVSQKRSRGAHCEITSFARDQAANEDEFELRAGICTARVTQAE
jgi:hypothetical protein